MRAIRFLLQYFLGLQKDLYLEIISTLERYCGGKHTEQKVVLKKVFVKKINV